jgi:hypothetical protein
VVVVPPLVWDPVAQVLQLPGHAELQLQPPPLYLVSPPHGEQLELPLLAY